jgi:hypothetical protein
VVAKEPAEKLAGLELAERLGNRRICGRSLPDYLDHHPLAAAAVELGVVDLLPGA